MIKVASKNLLIVLVFCFVLVLSLVYQRRMLKASFRGTGEFRVVVPEMVTIHDWLGVFAKLKGGEFYSELGEDMVLANPLFADKLGFYIDVGANQPNDYTVTRWFYERGWRGINIEPIVRLHEQNVKYRPLDINLNVAVSNEGGGLDFYEVENADGISTVDIEEVEKIHKKGLQTKHYKVQTIKLDDIVEKYAPRKNIDFIKIDVEGWEKQVLEGLNLKKYRPTVFCIEATYPNTEIPTHGKWEHLLLGEGYTFAFSEGINRYYVRNENQDVLARFQTIKAIFNMFKKLKVTG
jgi:FkbM family methyltransferase